MLVTTTYVFDETITILRKWMGFKKAVEVGKRLLSSALAGVIHISFDDFEKAWEIFLKYDDKIISFTDCVSFAVMQKLGMKDALTFDNHFKQCGFRAIALEI